MERTLSVSEARSRLTGLVQQVAERGGEIIITTRDEPMAVLMSYRVYRRWRERQRREAQAEFAELLSTARELIETTLEGSRDRVPAPSRTDSRRCISSPPPAGRGRTAHRVPGGG